MKSLKTIQTLSRTGKVLSKIAFILSVIGFCGCILGMISSIFARGVLTTWGSVTIHGMLEGLGAFSGRGISAVLAGWLIVCAGEAVLAKFAEGYFKNELRAGTPFTLAGAREMQRLGILTLAIPAGCAVAASIAEGIVAGFLNVTKDASDLLFDNGAQLALGVMFLVISLLCRCGAEMKQQENSDAGDSQQPDGLL